MVMASERKKRTRPSSAPTVSPRKTRSSSVKLAAPVAAPAEPAAKKRKLAKEKVKWADGAEHAAPPLAAPASDGAGTDFSKTIIVEACKQCNSFKTRATKVKEDLESSVLGITVVVNPVKPRRGCFEIRDDNGEVFVSLLDMKRPFIKMKELDMDEVIADIVKKIK